MHTRLFLSLFIGLSAGLNAADVFDGPGPGYRAQAGEVRKTPPTELHVTIHLPQVRELQFPPLPNATKEVAPLPKSNAFEKPIELFSAPDKVITKVGVGVVNPVIRKK